MGCVGINALLLSSQSGYRRAGIHHYIERLLHHLPQDDHLRYVIYSAHNVDWQRPDVRQVAPRWPTENRWLRILWEQTMWPMAAGNDGLELMHSMAFVTPLIPARPTMVTVYDLSFFHFPDRFPPLQRFYLQSQTRRSCRRALRIVAISESTREDVQRFFNIPRQRIDVVPPGVGSQFRPLPAEEVAAFRRRNRLPQEFILHVGTLQPRKNIPALIEALSRSDRPQLSLVLVGAKGWLYDEIFARVEALDLQDRVIFTGYVADEMLPFWYNAASMLVFPSVYEGFGMPIVQAMACGTPVVAAATSSIPEATGDAALLFPPDDVDALVKQMLTVLDSDEQAATMRERGLIQARETSWARSGQKMAEAYRRAFAAL